MNSISNLIKNEPLIQEKTSWKKYLFLATAGHFTNDFYNGFLSPLLPIIVVNLDLSLTSAGLLLSIFSISNSLLQPVTGLIADRMKRNYLILVGPLIAGVFMGFIGWVNQYWTLVVILCLSGIGTAIFHPQAAALVGGLGNRKKGFAMSIFNTAGVFGITIGSVIIIPLTSKFGLKSTIVTIIPALLLFVYSFKFLTSERIISSRFGDGGSIFRLIKSHKFLVSNLTIIVVIRATLTLAFSGFIPLYFASRGHTLFFGAVALGVFQFFSVFGMLIGGPIYDRIGARKLLMISFVFILPLALAFINLPSTWGLPFLAAMGFFLASSTPANIILGQQIAPNNPGFMSALMMGVGWGIAGILMTPIGAIADSIGLYWTFALVSLFSLVGFVLSYLLSFEKKNA